MTIQKGDAWPRTGTAHEAVDDEPRVDRGRLPVVGLALLRSVFVDPLTADGAEVALGRRSFAADPCPDAHAERKY